PMCWKPSPSPQVTGYAIFRGDAAQSWKADFKEIGRVKKDNTTFDDPVKKGTSAFYFVRTLAPKETADSLKVRTQPALVEDAVVSVIAAKEVRLSWSPGESDITGYHVERAVVEVFSEDEILRLKKDTP